MNKIWKRIWVCLLLIVGNGFSVLVWSGVEWSVLVSLSNYQMERPRPWRQLYWHLTQCLQCTRITSLVAQMWAAVGTAQHGGASVSTTAGSSSVELRQWRCSVTCLTTHWPRQHAVSWTGKYLDGRVKIFHTSPSSVSISASSRLSSRATPSAAQWWRTSTSTTPPPSTTWTCSPSPGAAAGRPAPSPTAAATTGRSRDASYSVFSSW